MSSRRSPSFTLIADTLRSHRRAIVLWIAGGTAAMYAIAAGFATEAARYEGGAAAMGAAVESGAQALRVLRWPAERLDTLGGYLTYHNVTLFTFFLALYAANIGVGAIRGAEPRHAVDMVLATGRPRWTVVRDRALGFVVALACITAGFGLGLALSMAAGGEPDLSGSLLTALACSLCALLAYGVGALVGQIVGSARSAKSLAAAILTGLYLVTNVADQIGPVGALRYVSPFHYFNESRALVPGHGFSVAAAAVLVGMSALLVAAAAYVFEHRDVDAALWVRRHHAASRPVAVQRPALRRLWTATILRDRVSLVAWSLATALGLGLMAWLEPSVEQVWDKLGMTRNIFGTDAGAIARHYLAFAAEILTPVIAAYVVTQAATWVADLEQRRVEILLSTPLSWANLVWQRVVATTAGVTAIVVAGLAGLAIGAIAVGAPVDAAGLARLAADALLFAVAFTALAAAVVAWLRSTTAVTVLALFAGTSYLVVLLVQLFAWPDWITRVSLFGAFGHPYLEIPAAGGLVFLGALAAVMGYLAVTIGGRAPKTA